MTSADYPADFEAVPECPGFPSSKDVLFPTQENWHNNARINWLLAWDMYASGYKEAADELVALAEKRSVSPDNFVYPALFLYRQYLELQLKKMIRTLRHLQGAERNFPISHNIVALWKETEGLLCQVFPDISSVNLAESGRLIREFDKVDPLSTAFRYPVDKNGKPSLPGVEYINLQNVRDVMAKIGSFLEAADDMAYEHFQFRLEMKREFRNEVY